MSRRWTLCVRLDHRYVGVRGWRTKEVLEAAGFNPRWDDLHREWYVYGKRHADALAAVEACGAALRIEGQSVTATVVKDRQVVPEVPPHQAPAPHASAEGEGPPGGNSVPTSDAQLALFEGA